MRAPTEEELREAFKWKPTGVVGPVKKRVEKTKWLPVKPPVIPKHLNRPEVISLGKEMMKRIRQDVKRAPVLHDPWMSRDVWRQHIYFKSGWNKVRLASPGFVWGSTAFLAYVIADKLDILPRLDSQGDHH